MKRVAQDIRDAFARRDVDSLDETLAMLLRTNEIREQELRRLREQAEREPVPA
jgi:hypothetical protein